jgi:cysteine-rich repeat protein
MGHTTNRLARRHVMETLGVMAGLWGCPAAAPPAIYLGPPGTQETHVVVEVRQGTVQAEVWRLRSSVEVEGSTSQATLPDSRPRDPLELPTRYVVRAPGRRGPLGVHLEALGDNGQVVGRARGTVDLVPHEGVSLLLDLARPCEVEQDCKDGRFCNGQEVCLEGMCGTGTQACPPAVVACVEVTCLEAEQRCTVEPLHQRCPPFVLEGDVTEPAFCDPVSGCMRGQPCGLDGDCGDGYTCNGAERCLAGRCMGGIPLNVDDDNPCTVDSCAEPAGGVHTDVRDGNRCGDHLVCVAGACVSSRCGDGVLDPAEGERCDDGPFNSDAAPDACRLDCREPRCGDGVRDTLESCDGTAGCRSDCTRCGDGFKQEVEACDNGASNSSLPDAVCRTDCTPRRCGDGVQDSVEGCDDGNTVDGDGCAATCLRREVCGDGVKDPQEPCDDGNLNPADGCDACRVTTWAARPLIGGESLATGARLSWVRGMAVDRAGNLFLADWTRHRIERVDAATGTVTTVAGTGNRGSSGDGGLATGAQLDYPTGIAVDGLGNLFVTTGNVVRRVDGATGIISTVAGSALMGFAGDGGPATSAQLLAPEAVAVDGLGNILIADAGNFRIRRVDAITGVITTLGGGRGHSCGDGPAVNAQFGFPRHVAVDGRGNVLVADSESRCVRRIDVATGTITRVAGDGSNGYSGDGGPATSAQMSTPWSVAVDGAGNLFVADPWHNVVRRVDAVTGVITTAAGDGTSGDSGDGGPATNAQLNFPIGVGVDGRGNLFVANARSVRRVDATTGIISTVAGSSVTGRTLDGVAATSALLSSRYVATDRHGNLLVSDLGATLLHLIQAPSGTIETIAGLGDEFRHPLGLSVDPDGNVLVVDWGRNCVHRVDVSTGATTTVAGGSGAGYGGDGDFAVNALLNMPTDVVADGLGNYFVADTRNHRIRRVDADTSVISTVAGTGTGGYSGDNGPAVNAELDEPVGVALDAHGSLYVVDGRNHCVRRVDGATGIISTVAGTGVQGVSADDIPATTAPLNGPVGLAIGPDGGLFIAESWLHRVRRVDPWTGIITTVMGNGAAGDLGDQGPATQARLNLPGGLATDSHGNLYIADSGNERIRRVDVATGLASTVGGAVEPEGMGPLGKARLADPRAVVVKDGISLFAGGVSGTVQATGVYPGQLRAVTGRYPQAIATANLARYQASSFGSVSGIAHDSAAGLLYLTETSAHRVHVVSAADLAHPDTWTIAVLANHDGVAGHADGPAATARFRRPGGLFLDGETLLVADAGNHVIRSINLQTRAVATLVGIPQTLGYHGDGGPAGHALLNQPNAVTRCANGDLFIADTGNNRVRRVGRGGTVSTVLGDGVSASSGEGSPARLFPVDKPLGLACDAFGNLYVTSRTAVRMAAADDDGVVDGSGPVTSVYGAPPRTTYPAVATSCLTGLAIVDDHRVQVTDSCTGILVELTRQVE